MPKNGIWGWNFKNLSMDSASGHPRHHLCQFSLKMINFEFFGLNLGKLPNYVRYLCSDIVEGVAESCMEAEMTWVEVDGDGWRWVHGLAIIALKNILAKQNSRPHIYLNQIYLNGMIIFS